MSNEPPAPAPLGAAGFGEEGTSREVHGAASLPAAPLGTGPEPARSRSGARRRWFGRSLAGFVVLVVLAAIVATFIPVPYYAITPGSGIDVATLISVPARDSHLHRGRLLLTDVNLVPLRAIDYLYYRLDNTAQVVSSSSLTGPANSAQYEEEGVIDMVSARQAATAVALRALGYRVRSTPTGVVVYQPQAGANASSSLEVGDVITSIASHRVRPLPSGELVGPIGVPGRPGSTVRVVLHLLGSSTSSVHRLVVDELYRIGTGSSATYSCLPVTARPVGTLVHVGRAPFGCLPFAVEQLFATTGEPFPVNIQDDGIVGPSAGLAFTLGLIEKLDRSDLTGGRRIAATGTMSIDGTVGDVGGVAQKTAAVRAAGATLFFVPTDQYPTAKLHAGSSLAVYPVSSIGQALADLERLGGKLTLQRPPKP